MTNTNTYTERREAKIERLRERAGRLQTQGETLSAKGWERLKAIPFGQPILVGHHSERSDRAYRAKSCGLIDKGYHTQEKASYYEEKADAIENNTAISSDDPDAMEKLQAKLAKLETYQAMMKEDHASARKQKLEPRFWAYQLTNNNANIKTVKQRIEQLTKRDEREERPDVEGEGYILREDKEENRIMFLFNGKPEEGTRNVLKKYGFRWSPTRGAWVRQLNENGRRGAKWAMEDIKKIIK